MSPAEDPNSSSGPGPTDHEEEKTNPSNPATKPAAPCKVEEAQAAGTKRPIPTPARGPLLMAKRPRREATRQDRRLSMNTCIDPCMHCFCWVGEEKLHNAAKARISRMVAPHARRRDLAVPSWVREHWQSGNRDMMANLLKEENFDRDA